ncbi:hypothetical protein [Ktedonosporobacter rubrisoli]|uniref:hypothetical protein n=1 Tax=Ktedonosporobacter rubrisoli TaxID=2509675 RepID=UPI0013EE9C82|nr:hypothetical protein [Ktedonosporobacter rubrisoli]
MFADARSLREISISAEAQGSSRAAPLDLSRPACASEARGERAELPGMLDDRFAVRWP